jgi:hypothetical protein
MRANEVIRPLTSGRDRVSTQHGAVSTAATQSRRTARVNAIRHGRSSEDTGKTLDAQLPGTHRHGAACELPLSVIPPPRFQSIPSAFRRESNEPPVRHGMPLSGNLRTAQEYPYYPVKQFSRPRFVKQYLRVPKLTALHERTSW